MAVYRQVHISFWQDDFVLNLTPEEKFFYIYLMTNSKTSQCGVYEISKKVMELETGYNRETIDKLIVRFIEYEKIEYNNETKEILLLNWLRYNSSKSPKVLSCITKELDIVKHLPFQEYIIDSLSIDYDKTRGKKKNNKNNNNNKKNNKNPVVEETIDYESIKTYFNSTCISLPKIRDMSPTRKTNIKKRIEEYSKDELAEVFTKAEASDFLSGRKTDWKSSFDWIIDKGHFIKILEGNYDNKQKERTTRNMTGLDDVEVGF